MLSSPPRHLSSTTRFGGFPIWTYDFCCELQSLRLSDQTDVLKLSRRSKSPREGYDLERNWAPKRIEEKICNNFSYLVREKQYFVWDRKRWLAQVALWFSNWIVYLHWVVLKRIIASMNWNRTWSSLTETFKKVVFLIAFYDRGGLHILYDGWWR